MQTSISYRLLPANQQKQTRVIKLHLVHAVPVGTKGYIDQHWSVLQALTV